VPPLAQFAVAWDCHAHVFGPRDKYPLTSAPRYIPALASSNDLRAHLARIGARHAVLVQASPYGPDNSCLLDSLAAMSGDHRAVVSLTPATITDRAITEYTLRGVRGVRINPGRDLSRQEVVALCDAVSSRIAGSRWHLEVNCNPEAAFDIAEKCSERVTIVFDHVAGFQPNSPNFSSMLARLPGILANTNWVKISGLDRVRHSTDDNDKLAQLIGELRRLAPGRLMWGSDWPHTPTEDGEARFRPVDASSELLWILRQLGDDASRVFESNPAVLYR
jgi:2-pyrone-4,6-dicarboxylate lactonase